MSTIDLTSFQTEPTDTVVTMPEGKPITLKPLMALGSEHDGLLLDLIARLGTLDLKDGQMELSTLGELMPLVGQLLTAAAPTKADAARLDRLPLMARFQVLMGYIEDQDLGGLSPSES